LEADAFGEICRTDNPGLKLFWQDVQKSVSKAFDIPLSELKNYEMKANQTLNYSI